MRLTFLSLCLLLTATASEARTWLLEADGSGDAPHIQAAIDSSSPGDTILLNDGVYDGQGNRFLVVPRTLTFRSVNGRDFTTIDFLGNNGFTLDAPSVRFEGLTLERGSNIFGGAIRVDQPGSVVQDCRFVACVGYGGAISYVGGGGEVYSSEFYECVGGTGQGVLQIVNPATVVVEDCIFARNSVGAAVSYLSNITFRRTTFHDNTTGGAGTASHLTINGGTLNLENCILSNGSGENPIVNSSGITNIFCTNIFGNNPGDWVGDIAGLDTVNGNFSLDPKFCDPGNGDFGLRPNSPCIDAPECGTVGYGGAGCTIVPTAVAEAGDPGREVAPRNPGDPDGVRFSVAPNPFRTEATITFSRRVTSPSGLHVYDVAGRVVRRLEKPGAATEITWDGRDAAGRRLPAGVYFVKPPGEAGKSEATRVILMR